MRALDDVRTSLPPAGRAAAPPGSPRVWVIVGFVVIGIAFGGFGSWAALASLDSAAIATGIVVNEGHRKTVQHLEGGIVQEILVRDGDPLKEGDVILRLHDIQARAVYDIVRGELDAARAQEGRLIAERDKQAEIQFAQDLLARTGVPKVAKALEGQRHVFMARRDSLHGEVAILEQRVAQFEEEIAGLNVEQEARQKQLRILEDEVGGLRDLLKQGSVPHNQVRAYDRKIAELTGQQGRTIAEVARAEQGIGEVKLQIIQLERAFHGEVVAELREVQERIFSLEERLIKAEDVLMRTEIRAPATGVVMDMQFHTAGEVIAPGQTILQVVPLGERLVIESQVNPIDIDDVAAGQEAAVRLTAFKLRATPIIVGKVINVSADRLVDPRTAVPYYLARIEIPEEEQATLGDLHLQPGMPVETLIKTGTRTVLAYFLLPLTEGIARGFREK